ncbi:MAG: peptidoglycan-binding domain-containing protein [Myxococcales bacterium]|nr:peptidoglycan-binding protein [Myxococcales bacterium]
MADYGMRARDKAGNTLAEAKEWAEKGFKFKLDGIDVKVARTPGPIQLHILMKDEEGNLHAGRPFEVRYAGVLAKGVTTKDGYVDAEIPPGTPEADLVVEGEHGVETVKLVFEKPEPLDTIQGLQQALLMLGYFCDDTGKLDDETKNAIKELQAHEGLTETGEPDDALRKKMKELLGAR